jgi:hypothetical protein
MFEQYLHGRMAVQITLKGVGLTRPADWSLAPVPNSLATERGRSVREFYAASESTPAARAPSLAATCRSRAIARRAGPH